MLPSALSQFFQLFLLPREVWATTVLQQLEEVGLIRPKNLWPISSTQAVPYRSYGNQ